MAAAVAKFAAKRYLGQAMDKHKHKDPCGDDDPFFTYVEKNGRRKKVKKQIPEFIPEHDADVLAKAKKSAYRLDMALFTFAGIRFGYSSLIGIIPEVGDLIDLYMALRVYKKCKEVDATLPSSVQTQMMINIAIDFVIGLIPFIGDLGDAAWKANTKNVALLEKHLVKTYRPKGMTESDAITAGYEDFESPPDYDTSQKKHAGRSGRNKGRPDDIEMGNRQSTGQALA